MDGFVRSSGALEPMGYYTHELLPFAYSLAGTFTVANRWFCSVPGPTYPNRRFLLAGTAFGGTTTSPETLLDPPPPHGTIFDHLSAQHISWCDYFTDVPMTAVIPSIILNHTGNHALISKFFHDCQAGTLPSVSFLDPGVGAVSSIVSASHRSRSRSRRSSRSWARTSPTARPRRPRRTRRTCTTARPGPTSVIQAILQSPKWSERCSSTPTTSTAATTTTSHPRGRSRPTTSSRSCSRATPRAATTPTARGSRRSSSPPTQSAPGSAISPTTTRPILATIERKWNLPALTARDANANHVMDFLDPANPALLSPPYIAAPPKPAGL